MKSFAGKLTAKQEMALAALLKSKTHVEAAKTAGISVTSLWRIMRSERFQAEYARLRCEIVDLALQRLQMGSNSAVTTLLEIVEDRTCPANARSGASKTVLEINIKIKELADLESRIEQLEKTIGGAQ